MAYDFKKEFRELYRSSGKPSVVTVPPMSYVAVRDKGDPHELVKRDVIPRRTHTTTITQNLDSVNTT